MSLVYLIIVHGFTISAQHPPIVYSLETIDYSLETVVCSLEDVV